MPTPETRYAASGAVAPAPGWNCRRVVRASRLNGANGMRTGTDGRIYVAQVAGSCVSAIDPDSGDIAMFSAMGAGITAPDDLAFDEAGNLYCTEITENRISVRRPDGRTEILLGDVPVANPITYHQGRLIAGECRVGARIMEIDRNGGAPRVILADVPMVNAFEVGPDGKLYFPVMGMNEIWRIDLAGGEPEVVARDLGVPDSLKFDRQGRIVSTQVASGQVLRIDPRTGTKEVLADIGPGLDNCTFVGDRIFVSHITGGVFEILEPGKVRPLVEKGMQWPMGLALGGDGALFIADGGFSYTLSADGQLDLQGMLFTPGHPGFTRGVTAGRTGEWIVTTANGDVARWRPAAQEHEVLVSGRNQLMGVCTVGAAVVFAEFGTGKVLSDDGGTVSELASGLDQPMGVAAADDGTVFVSEAGGGRVVKLTGGRSETVIDGLVRPEGIAVAGGRLYTLDVGAHQLVASDLSGGNREVIASGLPVGTPDGVPPQFLGGVGDMCGPMLHFAGLAAGADGTIYVSGDAEGSVLALRPA